MDVSGAAGCSSPTRARQLHVVRDRCLGPEKQRCSKRPGLGVISSMSAEPAPALRFEFLARSAVVVFS